jgi:SAM-dependent methyltransferase
VSNTNTILKTDSETVRDFYNASYEKLGFSAQRKYPNEELCRFMGRNFFHMPHEKRKDIKILETGCGSGANLWMIAREGFSAYRIDISQESILLCKKMLESYHVSAELQVQDMAEIYFPGESFDAVVDVFSSYCLTKAQVSGYLKSVAKILKPGGIFFSYFPSKKSDCYQFPEKACFIDSDTLNSILRKDAPFHGQLYPFRFLHPREYENMLLEFGFEVQYLETVSRTYSHRQEIFEFITIEAKLHR